MQRRYTITYFAITKEVFPVTNKIKYSWQLEPNQIFKRKKLIGKLEFINDVKNGISDFDFFKDIELTAKPNNCAEIKILIEKLCNGLWIEDWKGFFSTEGGSFDFDRCIFQIQPEPDDVYRCVLDSWEKKLNMFDYPSETVVLNPGTITFETCDETRVFTHLCGLPDEIVACTGYANAAEMFANGWCIAANSCSDNDPGPGKSTVHTSWKRELLHMPCIAGVCGTPPPSQGWVFLFNDCGGATDECIYYRCGEPPNPIQSFDNGVMYMDVLEIVIRQSCTTIVQLQSIFFNFNPNTLDPHYVSGINYVTQTASQVDNLVINQMSDIVDPAAYTNASLGEFTLKQWLDWAREVFNVYWDIFTDLSGNIYFRMEHFSFYKAILAIDLYNNYQQYTKALNKYEHSKTSIPEIEKWQWQIAENKDFVGVPVYYSTACSSQGNVTTHSPELLSTDLIFMLGNSSIPKDTGFVMTSCTIVNGNLVPNYEVGLLTNQLKLNGHLSWANLHYHYHRDNRYLAAGNMNNVNTYFVSWKQNIKQVQISIPNCCDEIDAGGYAITELGEKILFKHAFIDKMELDFSTNILSLNLTYSI